MCINCGWRQSDVPPLIQAQVKAHLGKPYMDDRYTHDRIGTGKPPLSGWDRVKRRRAREGTQAATQPPGAEGPSSRDEGAAEGPSVIAI